MGRPLRMYQQEGFYFVTVRTLQARLFLRPSADLNAVVGGVLARAVQLHGVDLFAYVFASNHAHLLLRARDGVLSDFMQFFSGNLARKVGRLIDWRGPFWERRFSAEPVLDDGAMLDRLKYILAHGVKEGLVSQVEEWPGVSCAAPLLGDLRVRYNWYHWSRRWSGGKLKEGGADLLSDQWAEAVEFELAVLPQWSGLDRSARIAAVRGLIGEIEEEGRVAHPKPLGRAAVKAQDPQRRPDRPKRSPRPMCHTSTGELRKQFRDTYRVFLLEYRAASARFLAGDVEARFPPLAFRPAGFSGRRRHVPRLTHRTEPRLSAQAATA